MGPRVKTATILLVSVLGGCAMMQRNAQHADGKYPDKPYEQPSDKPALPFHDWDVCPFECCTYRDWSLSRPVAFHRTHDKTSPIVFQLDAGQSVTGVTGVAITTKYGTTKVLKDHADFAVSEDDDRVPLSAKAGETLYTLNYQGEWMTLFWREGRLYSGGIPGPRDCELTPESCEYLWPESSAEETWWVMVRGPGGEIGWSDETGAFEHMDACGD